MLLYYNKLPKKKNATVVIIDSSVNGLYMAPIVAVNLEAGYASNVVALPSSTNPFIVKRKAFSNKAFSHNNCNRHKSYWFGKEFLWSS